MKILLATIIIIFTLNPVVVLSKTSLKIGLLIGNSKQRNSYYNLAEQFNAQYPDISINYMVANDTSYKSKIEKWLTGQEEGPDVLYWQAGERLFSYVKQDLIEPIDDLWKQESWDESFAQGIKDTIIFKNVAYALPFAYYHWGFYYKKTLFNRLNIQTPTTWEELLNACDILKKNDIYPILIGSNNHWRTAGWFDYLNLRINGLSFYQKLMSGEIPYTNKKVIKVFIAWKELIERSCFFKYSEVLSWQDSLPFLYRDLSGMILSGNFIEKQISPKHIQDFDFFRFPIINKDIPLYEVAPTDIFIIPKNSKNKKLAKLFLAFVGRPDIQTTLNQDLGYISPNIKSKINNNYFSNIGRSMLEDAKGVSQFYDRDTKKEMAIAGTNIFSLFLNNTDIEKTVEQLENARLSIFQR
jgi:multiple sugar transport system substrate-binding protein